MTKISIVIPVFNARPRICETLESVRMQTYPLDEIETIIVDDGSSDQSVRMARAFLQRHGMRGTVLVTGGNYGTSASLNRGWQAATGDWIQFLDGDDLLAPNKLEVQIRQVSQLPDVICSSWQRFRPDEDSWQAVGPVTNPNLVNPVLLKLVSPHAGLLGPALIRKKSLEAVAGFSDGVVYPGDEHLMLKLWGMGGKFVEAPSPSPMIFIRQGHASKTRASNANLARQHLQNVVIAEAMLRQQNFGTLTRLERKEIAGLCDGSLRELYENDWAAFRQYWQWLRETEPNFISRHSRKLKMASLVLGYESAQGLALAHRWIRSLPAMAVTLATTGGRSRFVGAAAVVLVVGAVSLAGMMASGLGNAARRVHTPLAEAPRSSENVLLAELPSPIRAAKVDQRSEIAPTNVRPVAKTASAVAPEPARASAPSAPTDDLSPVPRVELDRSSREAAALVAPATAKTALPTAPEAPHSSASPAAGAATSPAKRDGGSGDAGPQVAPPEAKALPTIAPEPLQTSTVPATALVQPLIEPAKADRSSREAAQQVATTETKIASATTRAVPSTSVGSTLPELPSRVPSAGADPSSQGAASRVPMLSPQEREGAERMVARGERDLADGNVASARQFFLRAATAGLARGAFLLAATYDPRELARLGVLGVQPSLAVARKWYERAHELGAPEAQERLARLVGG